MYSAIKTITAVLLISVLTACSNNQRLHSESLNDYLHSYWASVDPDSISPDSLEQRKVDFLFIVSNADSALRAHAFRNFVAKFTDVPDTTVFDYLGQRDSPLYSPQLLSEYLAELRQSLSDDDARSVRLDYLLENYGKNLPGHVIGDLPLILADGRKIQLHDLLSQCQDSDCKVWILFYDPECEACRKALKTLPGHIPEKDRMVAINVSDVPVEELPGRWISAALNPAHGDELHNAFYLPELPSLYLADRTGVVLAKDMPFPNAGY